MKNVILWDGGFLGCLGIIVLWILIVIAYEIISVLLEILAPIFLWGFIIGLILSIPIIIVQIMHRKPDKPKGRLFGALGAVIMALGMVIDNKWGMSEKVTKVSHSFLWLVSWTEDVSKSIVTGWHTVGLVLGYIGFAIIIVGGFFGLKALYAKAKR